MSSILDDIPKAAEWISKALSESGYRADFSPASIWEIERFFDENSRDGVPVKNGLLDTNIGARLFALGSYVGEVIRRNNGGEWKGDDSDPQVEINAELHLPNGAVCWPMQRAMKRFKLGKEEGMHAYVFAFGLAIGQRPAIQANRPWWKFW